MTQPLLYEQHMHTPLCKHASGLPGEYAAVAEQRGLKGIVVTCHNPLSGGMSDAVRMSPNQWNEYLELVESTRQEWVGRVDVRVGLECDFLPGLEKYLEKQISSAPLHHVLGSVHPFIAEYRMLYWNGDMDAYIIQYFEHIATAAETGLFDTMSHPDLIKNLCAQSWSVRDHIDEIKPRLDRIAKSGVAMELNTSGMYKPYPEYNPGSEILKEMSQRGIPCVIGADAHSPGRVADLFEDALETLQKAGYEHVSFFIDRKRQDIAIPDALASLKPLDS